METSNYGFESCDKQGTSRAWHKQKTTFEQHAMQSEMKHLLILLEVSEAHKGELVADEGSGWRKSLSITFIILDIIKVTGVYVTAQFWNYWGHG